MLEPGLQPGVAYPIPLIPWEAIPACLWILQPLCANCIHGPENSHPIAKSQPGGAQTGNTGHLWGDGPGKRPSKAWTLAQNHWGRGFWGLPYIEHSLERLRTNSGWHISLTALEWGTHPEEDQCGTLWSGGKGPLKWECCPLASPAWV